MAKAKGAAAQRRPRSIRSLGGSAGAVPGGRRRRQLVEVDVDYGSEDNYLFSYLGNERTFGIFVRTVTPSPTGTFLTLRFAAPAGTAVNLARAGRRIKLVAQATPLGLPKPSIGDRTAAPAAYPVEPIDDPVDGTVDEAMDEAMDEALDDAIDEAIRGELDTLDAELEAERDVEVGVALTAELKIEGEVIWVNPYRPSVKDNLCPGMGIRFVALDETTHRRLLALVGRVAYL